MSRLVDLFDETFLDEAGSKRCTLLGAIFRSAAKRRTPMASSLLHNKKRKI